MDSQTKASLGAIDGVESRELKQRRSGGWLLGLRVVAMILSLGSAIVLGVDKQTEVVPIQLVDSLPPLNVPVTAKWRYLSAFVYFVVGNAIAGAYAAVSIIISISGKRRMVPILITLDLIMVGLLFSSNGAATAVGVLGYKGNSHVRWNKVCNVFGRFCNQVAAAIVISMFASIVFMLLVIVSSFRLYKKSS